MNDDEHDQHFEEVARELQANAMRPGVWLKALTAAGGDAGRARSLYIKYRIEQLARPGRQARRRERQASFRRLAARFWGLLYLALTTLFGFAALCGALSFGSELVDPIRPPHEEHYLLLLLEAALVCLGALGMYVSYERRQHFKRVGVEPTARGDAMTRRPLQPSAARPDTRPAPPS